MKLFLLQGNQNWKAERNQLNFQITEIQKDGLNF